MKELFIELENHLLFDEVPSKYIMGEIRKGNFNEYPLNMISCLEGVEQNPKYHPEGNVLVHTMMVIDEGAKLRKYSKQKSNFMLALLLHDIGKAVTTRLRNGRLTSYNHDIEGAKMADEFLKYFKVNDKDIKEICSLVRYHMQLLFIITDSKLQKVDEIIKYVDIDELCLLSQSDRMGRAGINQKEKDRILRDIKRFKGLLSSKKY